MLGGIRCLDRLGGHWISVVVAWGMRVYLLVTVVLMLAVCMLLTNRSLLPLLGVYGTLRRYQNLKSLDMESEAETGVDHSSSGAVHSRIVPGCPSTPPNLRGKLEVEEAVSVSEAEARHRRAVRPGGLWWPAHCVARWSLAVLVPYRDRQHQVGAFLNHMHPFLQRQQLNYSIYFIEQEGTDLFNRARLLNVGFLEARKEGPWDCYAFHDVDMLPENDFHLYHCSAQPRHLAVATSTNNYRSSHNLPFNTYFGGACLMTEAHIRKVNGWSNIYWGWGAEDDDMWRRIAFADMAVWRYPPHYARYKMIKHKSQVVNQNRYKMLERNTGRFIIDGLNSLNYTVRATTRHPLYTHILADVGSSKENTTINRGVAARHHHSLDIERRTKN